MKLVLKMHLLGKDVAFFRRNLEKEFYKTLQNFLRVNQIFGAAPIGLSLYSFKKEGFRTISDKVKAVSHFFYGLFCCACVCFASYLQHQEVDSSLEFITRILFISEYVMGSLKILLVTIGCQYQRRYYSVFFRRLVNIDMSLHAACGIQPNFESTKTNLRRLMIGCGLLFGIIISVDFVHNYINSDNYIRSFTVYSFPNLVSTLALMQHTVVVDLLRDKLKTINAAMRTMAVGFERNDQHRTVNGKLDVFSVLSMNLEIKKSHYIRTLRRQHGETCRLIEVLNECFGLLIVLILASSYIILSTQFYVIYEMSEGFVEVSFLYLFYILFWIILHAGKIFLVVYSINGFIDEQRRTGYLISDVGVGSSNDDVTKQLKLFSDQLLHERTPPNALRIITLDLTLVGTMIGTLATYLIILIQFDASARDKKPQN